MLEISQYSIRLSAKGGKRSIKVTCDGDWCISSPLTQSWGVLKKNGDRLVFSFEPNTNAMKRTDYIYIKSGSILKKINIYQTAAKSLDQSTKGFYINEFGEIVKDLSQKVTNNHQRENSSTQRPIDEPSSGCAKYIGAFILITVISGLIGFYLEKNNVPFWPSMIGLLLIYYTFLFIFSVIRKK